MPVSTSPRVRIRVTAPEPPASGLPAAPSWVKALTVNRWAAIQTTNTIASLDPEDVDGVNPDYPGSAPWRGNSGQDSVTAAYSGGALAANLGARGVMLAYGGGHHDYHGTEVYGLDLGVLGWTRYNDPYPDVVSGAQSAPGGWYPDHPGQPNGAPGTPHTYQQIDYDPVRKCMVSLRCQVNESPSVVAKAALFPLAGSALPNYQWQRGSSGSSSSVLTDGWAARDTLRNVIHTQGGKTGGTFEVFNPSTGAAQDAFGTWTGYSAKSTRSQQAAAYDPVNDIVVVYAPEIGRVLAYPAGSPGTATVTLSTSTPVLMSGQAGFKYSPALGGFVIWGNRSAGEAPVVSLLKMNAGAAGWAGNGWTFTRLTDVGNTVAPPVMNYGPFGRFQVMTYADAEVALAVTTVTAPLYAFRLA